MAARGLFKIRSHFRQPESGGVQAKPAGSVTASIAKHSHLTMKQRGMFPAPVRFDDRMFTSR